MRPSILVALGLAVVAGLAAPAAADDRFRPLPPAAGQDGKFELRVVHYDDGVHGEMTVEVRNLENKVANFSARGLYFMPDDPPDTAPQRLAVIGGIRTGSEDAPRELVSLAAGATAKIRFDVYCIDEDRHAPGSSTQFTLAPNRIPEKLMRGMEVATQHVVAGIKLKADDDQQRRIQPLVWMARKDHRARLKGDGRQERR
jgi:hypothetical protein